MSKIIIDVPGYIDPVEEAAIKDVVNEYCRAIKKFGPFHSAHEGYGIILEELDELWDEIKMKDNIRDSSKIRAEATQVAAMALRMMIDVCSFKDKEAV